jgi:hypothetical protein
MTSTSSAPNFLEGPQVNASTRSSEFSPPCVMAAPRIPHRDFGATGAQVSLVGMGCSPFGHAYGVNAACYCCCTCICYAACAPCMCTMNESSLRTWAFKCAAWCCRRLTRMLRSKPSSLPLTMASTFLTSRHSMQLGRLKRCEQIAVCMLLLSFIAAKITQIVVGLDHHVIRHNDTLAAPGGIHKKLFAELTWYSVLP